ncbi:MAG TPA: hypothetical protein VFQ39_20025, partial [Longimicrobium sp.]|nr:hypothetical protein [Longimicrobium sp.]
EPMRLLKVLLGVAAVGAIAAAFRDWDRGGWLRPALPGADDDGALDLYEEEEDEEPVLGYDGMDRDTLVAWLDDANLDEETLLRIRRYEEEHEGREPVLSAVDDLLASFG